VTATGTITGVAAAAETGASLKATTFPALGTTATVVVAGTDAQLVQAVDVVRAELSAIDKACSRFRPDSELSRLNAARGRRLPASPLLIEAVEVALRAARITGGLVDPTIGGALRRLGYDRDFAALAVTDPAHREVMTLVTRRAPGWRVVACNRTEGTITVPDGVELDLGATAKALAADRAAAGAERAARCAVLVSLGGDIAVAGRCPPGGWPVRVTDNHAARGDGPGQTVSVVAGGVATSGTAVRRWRHGDIEVHHLVDPATGQPASETWRTATVAAATCVDANTASTAAIILGPSAPAWLSSQRLPARLVAADGAVTTVAGWPLP
jgi:thiamine biosynthesis lipoprotein